MDEIEERVNGTVSLLGINEVAGNRGREEDNHGDDHNYDYLPKLIYNQPTIIRTRPKRMP